MTGKAVSILVVGAAGQIGTELTLALRSRHGSQGVVAGCHRTKPDASVSEGGVTEYFDVTSASELRDVVDAHRITHIFNLASILSGEGEERPDLAWKVNVDAHRNVLDVAVKQGIASVFWPSSIAVFGPDAPKDNTPQGAALTPQTIYGVTKVTGELLCNYYFKRYGLDVRSIRLPGLITTKTFSGGGTSDYSVEMLLKAAAGEAYTCFVREDTTMPLLAMSDAIAAIERLMDAPTEKVAVRTAYNIAALSFSAAELAREIRRHVPDFEVSYVPDFRQAIADSWPNSLDGADAARDWGWTPRTDLAALVRDILAAPPR